eukprot:Skav234263  [mRNA]  locus=scaffold1464:913846:920347:+ [translate_table: standard]
MQCFSSICAVDLVDGVIFIWCVEHEGALAEFNIIGIAVDPLAVSKLSNEDGVSPDEVVYRGDLLDPQVGLFLLGLIESGRVIGGMGSPPCSTISAARRVPLNVRGAPRPLRDRDKPWEPLKYCSPKEVAAVELGSILFLLNKGLLGEIRYFGGWVSLEHPVDPGPPVPSFFNTTEVEEYKAFTRTRYLETHQCMFGAASKKPTGLLVPLDSHSMARRPGIAVLKRDFDCALEEVSNLLRGGTPRESQGHSWPDIEERLFSAAGPLPPPHSAVPPTRLIPQSCSTGGTVLPSQPPRAAPVVAPSLTSTLVAVPTPSVATLACPETPKSMDSGHSKDFKDFKDFKEVQATSCRDSEAHHGLYR